MKSLALLFTEKFGYEPQGIFFCPGRVNLIGEHIDYNGGKVMPCAIGMGIMVAVGKNIARLLNFHSFDFPGTASLHLQQTYSRSGAAWYNYPLGVIHHMLQEGKNISGLDFLFAGNLPAGAGLSSSAAIEVLTAFAINTIFDHGYSKKEIALLAKKAENDFIGVNCGIMDQFAVSFGKKNQAILLDCDSLDFEYLPFSTVDHSLLIMNTNKSRKLIESKYNERFAECGEVLRRLKKGKDIRQLCDLTVEEFKSLEHLVQDPVLVKRAWHVVSENARVNDAAEALKKKDLRSFGEWMFVSHESLRHFYEVTGLELDTLVDFCKDFEDCAGARMTGAGFGGCAIALVKKDSVEKFRLEIGKYYRERVGYDCTVMETEIGEGARKF
jgi:galactokinase